MIANITGTVKVPQLASAPDNRDRAIGYLETSGQCRVQVKGETVLYRLTDFDMFSAAPVNRTGKLSTDGARGYRVQANDGSWQRVLIIYGDNGARLRLNIFDGSDTLFVFAQEPYTDTGFGPMLSGLSAKSMAAFDKLWELFQKE